MQVEMNQGSGRVWDSFARSLGGGRSKVSPTPPLRPSLTRGDGFRYCPTGWGP